MLSPGFDCKQYDDHDDTENEFERKQRMSELLQRKISQQSRRHTMDSAPRHKRVKRKRLYSIQDREFHQSPNKHELRPLGYTLAQQDHSYRSVSSESSNFLERRKTISDLSAVKDRQQSIESWLANLSLVNRNPSPELDRSMYNCYVAVPKESNISVTCTALNEDNVKQDNGDIQGPELLTITLSNIKDEIPSAGKIVVKLEIPRTSSETVQLAPCQSTVVRMRSLSPIVNYSIDNNVTITSYHSHENLLTTPKRDFLTVTSGFRPRCHSDSRLFGYCDSSKPPSPSSRQLPRITVKDFSNRERALQKAMKGQPEKLKSIFNKDAEVFNLLKKMRPRSCSFPTVKSETQVTLSRQLMK